MKRALVFLVAFGVVLAQAAPELLIAQLKGKDEKTRMWVGDDLSAAFDQEGRVSPILWSNSDLIFRKMLESTRVKYPDLPSEADVFKFVKEFHVNYVLIYTADHGADGLLAEGRLFKGGVEIWKHSFNQKVEVQGVPDRTSDALSLARTWTVLLGNGPLKSLPARTKIDTPKPDPGPGTTINTTPDQLPVPKPPPASQATLVQAQKLISDGLIAEGISLLRDAVDSNPFDFDARRALVEALLIANAGDIAAEEALRAANLSPEGNVMRLIAARAFLKQGRVSEAEAALNEALVRDGSGHLADLIKGEIQLLKGKPELAVESYTSALQTKESFDARFGRATAYGLSGKADECVADIKVLPMIADTQRLEAYERLMGHIATRVTIVTKQLKSILQEARLTPKSQPILARTVKLADLAASMDRLLSDFGSPAKHLSSHQKRELAHKLLAQAVSEAIAFVQRGDDEAATDSAISVGEAIRRYQAVQAEFDAERR